MVGSNNSRSNVDDAFQILIFCVNLLVADTALSNNLTN